MIRRIVESVFSRSTAAQITGVFPLECHACARIQTRGMYSYVFDLEQEILLFFFFTLTRRYNDNKLYYGDTRYVRDVGSVFTLKPQFTARFAELPAMSLHYAQCISVTRCGTTRRNHLRRARHSSFAAPKRVTHYIFRGYTSLLDCNVHVHRIWSRYRAHTHRTYTRTRTHSYRRIVQNEL